MPTTRPPTRGFFVADGLAAMVVLSAVIVALGVAIHGQRRVAVRCAELRSSAQIAERAAVELLTSGVVPEAVGESRVRARKVGSTPAGAWMEIVVTTRGRDFSLFVLAPETVVSTRGEQRP